ncbi:NfeD family protein [Leptolyngbya sp. FACHB-711]|uniref:NfeD family protein n=1 Tax=unclassified Leptolyngbya TaxID=2650499 RepID=UPI001682F1FF|nr:NfeD family protein [Leptolyngbya sp. FACHB-711]MBD1850890.1 NfeD family protein [Cyanobacteria bacterium FACHB-502]MBD2027805.1 NfeD family protein [Leptolyngbya sp. FACHB-711]
MSLSLPMLWLIAGVILCVLEFILPTAFVELTMGISAILVAIVAQFVPSLGIQVGLWLILSVVLTLLTRRLLPRKTHHLIQDTREAQTLTPILPGQTGRVIYEGNSWQARCDDEGLTIPANQKVYVVERRGTTLIVMPENLLRSGL